MSKNMKLNVRKAVRSDLNRLMEIFDSARRFMAHTGNPNQWVGGYPQRELMESEVESGHCYVCETEEGRTVATLCFIPGPDPAYVYIEDGAWPDERPYYVIHRLASDGSVRGIGKICIDWCWEKCHSLRADTHADNHIMQQLLEKNGFMRCGIIYVHNGTPRIAYQRVLSSLADERKEV